MQGVDRSQGCICFEGFELDLRAGELRPVGEGNGAKPIRLAEQPFRILTMLLEHPGQVVTREEIRKRLWPNDTIVEFEHSISAAMNRLRQALGDSAENPRYIETLARRGYRFISPVQGLRTDLLPVYEERSGGSGKDRPGARRSRLRPAVASLLVLITASVLAWFAVLRESAPRPEPRARRLTANPAGNPVTDAHISPDGKYLAYADQGGIHLQVIDTGETRAIPPPGNVGYEVTSWFPVGWFPDGTKLLTQATSLGAEHSSVWMASVLGGAPREIRENALAWSVSPNGSLIAYTATFSNSETWSTFFNSDIWVMGSDGEQDRRIAIAAEGESLSHVVWAPDSQRIAYERFISGHGNQGDPEGTRCDIEMRDLKGGKPTVVLSDLRLAPRFGGGLWWLPDQGLIFSLGETGGGTSVRDANLWEINLEPGSDRPKGKPKQITRWSGFSLAGPNASSDGKKLVFARLSAQADAYVGELERAGTRLKAPPHRLTQDERNDWPDAWTADGKSILFQSDRSGKEDIYRQALDQGSAEPLVSSLQANRLARLSPDGAWVLYESSEPGDNGRMNSITAPGQLRRVPVLGGPSEPVLTTHGWQDHQCARFPATLCLLGEESDDQKELVITAFDPLKGRGREVARISEKPGFWYGWNLSPDGSEIAVLFPGGGNQIRLLPVGGGRSRDLIINGWYGLSSLDWAVDNRGIYVSSVSPRGATLLHIYLNGRASPIWEQRGSLWTWGVPSPDGRHLAILGYTMDSNAWMLEGF